MTPEAKTVKLSSVVFDEVIYPRRGHDPALVQRYADVIEEIEASKKFIAIAADGKLLDGKHRWLAYRKVSNGDDREIPVLVYPVTAPHDQFRLAVQLNCLHGWQLTDEDKKRDAITMLDMGFTYETIAADLSVGKVKVTEWLSRTVKEKKERRDAKIFDMWMACHTQDEIAEACGAPQQTVADVIKVLQDWFSKTDSVKAAASHVTDFDPPVYNIWKQQEKTPGSKHFGNSEIRWVDNLLYLYTQPFDVVVDPFAGGGSTIDLCKKRFRRYWVSDRRPVVERETEIRKHDMTDGLPALPRWKDVALVPAEISKYEVEEAGEVFRDGFKICARWRKFKNRPKRSWRSIELLAATRWRGKKSEATKAAEIAGF